MHPRYILPLNYGIFPMLFLASCGSPQSPHSQSPEDQIGSENKNVPAENSVMPDQIPAQYGVLHSVKIR